MTTDCVLVNYSCNNQLSNFVIIANNDKNFRLGGMKTTVFSRSENVGKDGPIDDSGNDTTNANIQVNDNSQAKSRIKPWRLSSEAVR